MGPTNGSASAYCKIGKGCSFDPLGRGGEFFGLVTGIPLSDPTKIGGRYKRPLPDLDKPTVVESVNLISPALLAREKYARRLEELKRQPPQTRSENDRSTFTYFV